jgi:hypothetical protein
MKVLCKDMTPRKKHGQERRNQKFIISINQRLLGLNCIGERALIKAAAQPTQRLIL